MSCNFLLTFIFGVVYCYGDLMYCAANKILNVNLKPIPPANAQKSVDYRSLWFMDFKLNW